MKIRMLSLLGLALAGACADAPNAPSTTIREEPAARFGDLGRLGNYVAMGTSLSMGVMSNGVVGSDQAQSWPAQLAEIAGTPFTQPLIDRDGCQPPLASPLSTLRRVNGETAFARSAICSPLVAGISLPTQNLALSEAITANALGTTPQSASPASWPLRGEFYSRVLGPNQTQLSAMLAQQPDLVSVEFGINEVLGARSGLLAPGVTIVPFWAWQPAYDQLITGVKSAEAKVLLVAMISDVTAFPSFRTGAELHADRAGFTEVGISLSDDCGGAASANHVNVAGKVVAAYAQALAASAAGQPAPTLSCADVAGTLDYVLTPTDMAALADQVDAMNAHIRQVAASNGFAFMQLDVLFRAEHKAPFNVKTLLSSDQPYGPYISLDGAHPSAAGHTLVAREAAKALNVTYHLGVPRGFAAQERF